MRDRIISDGHDLLSKLENPIIPLWEEETGAQPDEH